MCLEISQLDPGKFLTPPGLTWKEALEKSKVELELLIEIDML